MTNPVKEYIRNKPERKNAADERLRTGEKWGWELNVNTYCLFPAVLGIDLILSVSDIETWTTAVICRNYKGAK